jgi:RNA polymerase sigma factor (sigma-70 family)
MTGRAVPSAVPVTDAAVDFDAFFTAQFEPLFQTLYLVCGNRTEAEELAQETMARAFQRWDRVAAADDPVAYVFRVAFNLNRRRLRRMIRGRRAEPAETTAPDPADVVERSTEVRRLLASLPIAQRQALVLVDWLGFSTEEAGSVLGIESVSVRGRIHRARRTLRSTEGDDDG